VVSPHLLPGKISALADAAADDRGENIECLAGEAARIAGLDRLQASLKSQAPLLISSGVKQKSADSVESAWVGGRMWADNVPSLRGVGSSN